MKAGIILKQVKNSFPSLENVSIKLVNKTWGGSGGARWNPISGYRMVLNLSRINKMNESAFRGLIAHELSHFEQFLEYSFIGLCYYMFINYLRLNYFPNIINQEKINKIELDADYRAIKRGYGKNLIDLTRFEKINKIKHKNKYLSVSEIKLAMKKII